MAKLLLVFLCLTALIFTAYAAPLESLSAEAGADDLSTADSVGIGYYSPVSSYYGPYYGRSSYGYKYGGYGGYGYGGYGGYRGYGRYYSRPIYPVFG